LIKIGVLALQGAVREHIQMLKNCGATPIEIKRINEFDDIDGLIIPGGESTTISKLVVEYGFFDKIREFANLGKPVYGTCAGLILMSKRVIGEDIRTLSIMDIEVRRNALGRQIDSMEVGLKIPKLGEKEFPAIFIRAPIIENIGEQVEILAKVDGKTVMVQKKNLLVSSFHPELSDDNRIHNYFLNLVDKNWR
jgi:5'-phosphate synthase pdxT subunit